MTWLEWNDYRDRLIILVVLCVADFGIMRIISASGTLKAEPETGHVIRQIYSYRVGTGINYITAWAKWWLWMTEAIALITTIMILWCLVQLLRQWWKRLNKRDVV
jgi:cell division protein FtsW (lipid II flippase)